MLDIKCGQYNSSNFREEAENVQIHDAQQWTKADSNVSPEWPRLTKMACIIWLSYWGLQIEHIAHRHHPQVLI